jgi:hypothetical protein
MLVFEKHLGQAACTDSVHRRVLRRPRRATKTSLRSWMHASEQASRTRPSNSARLES